MQYKTIVLALLQERPGMHEELRKKRQLLPALEMYARELKTIHESWMETLRSSRPGSDPTQIASEAAELALKDMVDRLPPESAPEGQEPLSLDAAMVFLRNHTSRG